VIRARQSILAMNSRTIPSINNMQVALLGEEEEEDDDDDNDARLGELISVLTYNPCRKLKSALITIAIGNLFVGDNCKKHANVRRGPIVRIDDAYVIGEKVRGRPPFSICRCLTSRDGARGERVGRDSLIFFCLLPELSCPNKLTMRYRITRFHCKDLALHIVGAFAVVKKAIDRATGQLCTIKTINRSSLDKRTDLALQNKVSILSTEGRHTHIMALYSIVIVKKYYLVTKNLWGGNCSIALLTRASTRSWRSGMSAG
jgi:hypothetical protein